MVFNGIVVININFCVILYLLHCVITLTIFIFVIIIFVSSSRTTPVETATTRPEWGEVEWISNPGMQSPG
jgi:hypothetical protein